MTKDDAWAVAKDAVKQLGFGDPYFHVNSCAYGGPPDCRPVVMLGDWSIQMFDGLWSPADDRQRRYYDPRKAVARVREMMRERYEADLESAGGIEWKP